MIRTSIVAVVAGLCVSGAAVGQCSGTSPVATMSVVSNAERSGDIVETAVSAGSFKTLVAAVQAAGLVETLKSKGPFTVFAPTDEAFSKLPAGTVEMLLKPENLGTLRQILTYHVVPGRVMAEQVVDMTAAETVNGQRVDFVVTSDGVTIDGARVIKTDVNATNGVIHVIDRVIMPSTQNIVETADEAGSFGTLIAAAKAAGLVPALTGEGPITVLAPTDEAFEALGHSTINDLLKPANKHKLAEILKYHVIPGRVYARDAVASGIENTLQGDAVRVVIDGGRVTINGAGLIASDIETSNGVIQVIDRVLLPK